MGENSFSQPMMLHNSAVGKSSITIFFGFEDAPGKEHPLHVAIVKQM